MQLDMESGMDPCDSTIKLRAAEGLEAVDFFFPGYHVWAKLIESLADLGYDSGNVVWALPVNLPCCGFVYCVSWSLGPCDVHTFLLNPEDTVLAHQSASKSTS